MNIICIIQARMGSTRLPGKVLLDLEGKPVLNRVLDRVLESKLLTGVVVATTEQKADDAIFKSADGYAGKVSVFRGSETDVLDRYYQAALESKADAVVRITSDCPLIDAEVIDQVVQAYMDDPSLDYVANVMGRRTYPRGLDVELIAFPVLKRVWQTAKDQGEREHVTLYVYRHPTEFKAKKIRNPQDYSFHRWTLDVPEDYALIKKIYSSLYPGNSHFKFADVLKLFEIQPDLIKMNQTSMQHNYQPLKIVACIQARMGSTRLPKKVLMDINGLPTIVQIANRLKSCEYVDEVVVSTSDREENRVILECAEQNHLPVYAGSEDDIVDRMQQTAKKFGASALVRITADCPLVDPKLVDEIIRYYLDDRSLDFVTNVLPPTYPDGLDIELISAEGLQRLWDRTRGDAMRSEWYNHDIRNNPDMYKIKNLSQAADMSKMRWTVDYAEDLELVREVYRSLSSHGEIFYMNDILKLLEENPQLVALNEKYVRDEAYYAALAAQKLKNEQV